MSNIYLIGYRATGKTSVSKKLSSMMNKKVIHMDEELERRIGKISTYVRNYGWNAFRDEESRLLKEISNKKDLIVDCGGGIITRDENIKILKKTGKCVLLKTDLKTISRRLIEDEKSLDQRPSLTGKSIVDEIKEVLNQRMLLYEKTADTEIETNNKSVEEISNEIKEA